MREAARRSVSEAKHFQLVREGGIPPGYLENRHSRHRWHGQKPTGKRGAENTSPGISRAQRRAQRARTCLVLVASQQGGGGFAQDLMWHSCSRAPLLYAAGRVLTTLVPKRVTAKLAQVSGGGGVAAQLRNWAWNTEGALGRLASEAS